MKPVEDQTDAQLQFHYDDLTSVIRRTSAMTGSGPGKAMHTTPAERAHGIRGWQDELHPVVAEMKRRGIEPRVFGARKARRNPQEATWLDYDVVSRRCAHDTPLGEVCLECEEEAEYDLESSAPGRWRERPEARMGEEHLHLGFCRTCGERLTPGHRPGSGVRGPSEHCVIERPGTRRNPPDEIMEEEDLDEMINSYIETALWSSTDDVGEPLDKKFDPNSFTQEDADKMAKDCKDFLDNNHDDIVEFMQVTGEDLISVGHLFWLTRNRHGSGFWGMNRGRDTPGEKLTKASHAYGEVNLYVGDEGNIYVG